MITIISGTNRDDSYSLKFAEFYKKSLEKSGVKAQILDLKVLPENFLFTEMYGQRSDGYEQLLEQYIYGVDKILMVSPEYNGSFSGILKAFIDSFEPKNIIGKKMAMIGVAAGRAGNLRGMDHMTNCMHYMKVHVMPNKLPISQAYALFKDDKLCDVATIEGIESHVQELINY
jgi:NAD(P)H-dependent FMN reductase